ncbi:MAG: DUF1501 domain-containing protein, partial [Bacteroidales bacterium]|nr:DUF1501 domain-containing protein [Bacteroidales bacterium]
MKRRTFLKNLSVAGSGAVMLGGMPIKALAGNDALKKIAGAATNDHVLVFVQLHGGNDGLNTLIPIEQFEEYKKIRPNLYIPKTGPRAYLPLDDSLPSAQKAGLHPDMTGFKDLYTAGKATVVHNVGYENMNLSHFRGRDIVFMGGGYDDTYASGWMGRFLDHEYPGYPDSYPSTEMPDPPGIEMSNALSLSFHRNNGIPIGFNVSSPQAFYDLISTVGLEEPPITFPDSHAGDELRYLMEFEKKSNEYAGRLKQVYDAGSNSAVVYPETYAQNAPDRFLNNPLSGQLRLIARLLKGGIKTRIFLCRIGLFDTHADQVMAGNTTMGGHAALLNHLSGAIKAFQDDLASLGLEERVLTMTFTEFGRRAYSNDSYGTDHGKSTPVFLFGSGLKGGVYGDNPDLTDLDNGNTKYAIDYRQVYTSVVMDWFGASPEAMEATYFNDWVNDRLDLIAGTGVQNTRRPVNGVHLKCAPNPVMSQVTFSIPMLRASKLHLQVVDVNGKLVDTVFAGKKEFGTAHITYNAERLQAGNYVALATVDGNTHTCRFIKH